MNKDISSQELGCQGKERKEQQLEGNIGSREGFPENNLWSGSDMNKIWLRTEWVPFWTKVTEVETHKLL